MVIEVFCSHCHTPLLAHCAECGLTPHHQQKSFILWKSFWPKGASQCSVHYLDLSTFKVWCEWLTDSVTNRGKSLSCYSQLKIEAKSINCVVMFEPGCVREWSRLLQERHKAPVTVTCCGTHLCNRHIYRVSLKKGGFTFRGRFDVFRGFKSKKFRRLTPI